MRDPATLVSWLALQFGFALLLAGLVSGAAMIARGVRLREGGDTAAAYNDVGYLKWFHSVTLPVAATAYVGAAVAALVVSLTTL